jgi:hypothetical protein
MQTRVDNFWRVPLCQAYIRVKRGKYRIAIPHSKSAQYTLGVSRASRLHQFARSCCSASDHFTTQIFFYFPFICPLKSGKEFLLEFAHSCSRLSGNQAVIDVGRDIDILPIFSTLVSHPH